MQTDGTVQMQKSDLRRHGLIADKYCLMLPYSKKNEPFHFNYSVITHEYDVLRNDGEIGDNAHCSPRSGGTSLLVDCCYVCFILLIRAFSFFALVGAPQKSKS